MALRSLANPYNPKQAATAPIPVIKPWIKSDTFVPVLFKAGAAISRKAPAINSGKDLDFMLNTPRLNFYLFY